MERITGIGGLFFRAQAPQALAHWYKTHLGINAGVDDDTLWHQKAGPTVFAPFEADTDYFGRPDQQTMVNFRVRNLDAMLARLHRPASRLMTGWMSWMA